MNFALPRMDLSASPYAELSSVPAMEGAPDSTGEGSEMLQLMRALAANADMPPDPDEASSEDDDEQGEDGVFGAAA